MRRIRRKVYKKEFGPSTRESAVYFYEIYDCGFLDEIKNFEREFKKALIDETFIKVEDALGCALVGTDEMEKFLDFCKEENEVPSSKAYQNWRNLPEETINPDFYLNDKAYRQGIIDALKMFKLEVLCTMEECLESYEKACRELEK